MGQKVIFIAIIVFLAAVVMYSFQSGLFKNFGSGSKSTSTASGTRGFFKSYDFAFPGTKYVPPPKTGTNSSGTSQSGGGQNQTSTKPVIAEKDLPKGFAIEQISPNWQKVIISYANAGTSNGYERMTISARLKTGESLDVTGWKVKAKKGEYLIPKAALVYTSYSVPQNIVLTTSERIEIYSSKGTVGNFKLNKCTGYLETLFDFKPPLPLSCPKVYESNSDLYDFTPKCQDYIRSLGTCKMPTTNMVWLADDSACRSYLDKISYGGCVAEHQGDLNFLSKEWRVWIERKILDSSHDRVFLFDKSGLLVDEFVY